METQIIKKSIKINAPQEKIWEILLHDNYTRIWYAEFSEGSHAETDWQVGSKAVFTDNSGNGLVSTVLVNQPHKVLSVEYQGIVTAGSEDYESDDAKNVKGGRETYRLAEKDGVIRLTIEADMAAGYFEMMSIAWDRALQKIKELAESK